MNKIKRPLIKDICNWRDKVSFKIDVFVNLILKVCVDYNKVVYAKQTNVLSNEMFFPIVSIAHVDIYSPHYPNRLSADALLFRDSKVPSNNKNIHSMTSIQNTGVWLYVSQVGNFYEYKDEA